MVLFSCPNVREGGLVSTKAIVEKGGVKHRTVALVEEDCRPDNLDGSFYD